MNYICIAEEGERDLIAKYLPNCNWPVIVTGVGAINIIQALSELPREAAILNIGFAGSANFDIGTVVEVTEVRLNHPNVTYPEPTLMLKPFDDGLWPIARTEKSDLLFQLRLCSPIRLQRLRLRHGTRFHCFIRL